MWRYRRTDGRTDRRWESQYIVTAAAEEIVVYTTTVQLRAIETRKRQYRYSFLLCLQVYEPCCCLAQYQLQGREKQAEFEQKSSGIYAIIRG